VKPALGAVPWEPTEGAELEEAWHFWDHPRWGTFTLEGARFAFHRHENVGYYTSGPTLWTYRPLDDAELAELTLPREQWGAMWSRAYEAWRSRRPAHWWAVADHDLHIIRSGTLEPPVDDDESWARAFADAQGIELDPDLS
jgi:hypothetical protein